MPKNASTSTIIVILCSLLAMAAVVFAGLGFQLQGQVSKEGSYPLFQKINNMSGLQVILGKLDQYAKHYILPTTLIVSGEGVEAEVLAPKSYSETNVQVEGIDEADIVKTDGIYMYIAVIDHFRPKVCIVKAYPPEDMSLMSTINSTGRVEGLYIYNDKLIVLTAQNPYSILKIEGVDPPYSVNRMPITTISIYDVRDRDNPILMKEFNVTGMYVTSRLKEGTLYVIAQCMAREDIIKPLVRDGLWIPRNEDYLWPPAFIVTIFTLNLDDLKAESSSYITPPIDRIYMSHDNLYIVSVRSRDIYRIMFEKSLEIIRPMLPSDVIENLDRAESIYDKARIVGKWLDELPSVQKFMVFERVMGGLNETIVEETYVYRFDLEEVHNGKAIIGIVPGRVLDQFAMHEKNGYFMIATTLHKVCITIEKLSSTTPAIMWISENCFYTLRVDDMRVVSKLEGLAKGERIYAARFVNNYAFLVTYRRVDPLYCIDISDPLNPKAIGYLKELGYSEYLHPYGNHYLIGIGVDADGSGRATGIKASLYDFSNPAQVVKVSEVKLDCLYSEALWTHHAFLFNPMKGYVAFPVPSGIAVIGIGDADLSLKGIISVDHARRSMYIENCIYAIGLSIVAADDSTLNVIAQLPLTEGH